MTWKQRVLRIDELPADIDYILFVDESGSSEMKSIKKAVINKHTITNDEKFFIVTGVLMHRDQIGIVSDKITELKCKFWPPHGMAMYKDGEKRVCFHSREIRKREGVFGSNILSDYENFMIELSEFLKSLDVKVFAVAIDKEAHFKRYVNPIHPYDLSMEFLLERLESYIPHGKKGVIVLEGRGKKPDKELLKQIVELLDFGTRYRTSDQLSFIKGVYFNLKWSEAHNNKKSYFGLEIADLFCHPISVFAKTGVKNVAFNVVEPKIYGYQSYIGKGYKKFP